MTIPIAFIVGSPRSGTTLLGDVLDLHPKIANWYEPYFVYDRYFKDHPNDRRTQHDATTKVKNYLQRELKYFQQHRQGQLITDKSPRNSLKIPFLLDVYPHARFIHILRDGRDATLSIRKEWLIRKTVLSQQSTPFDQLNTFLTYLGRQSLWRHKLAALRFQLGDLSKIFSDPKSMSHTTNRWEGHVGWGPQFPGWQEVIDDVSTLEFNAMQWRACVETILEDQSHIPSENFMTVRYEEFLADPAGTVTAIVNFLNLGNAQAVIDQMPRIKKGNYDKWKEAFTADEKKQIGPILQPVLDKLGYAADATWYD